MSRLHGIAGSPGIAIGPIARLPDATTQADSQTHDPRDDHRSLLLSERAAPPAPRSVIYATGVVPEL